ncbi:protein FATTY ACID EXPORT 3, chloroplastic [Cryptomeria japonica]|uniref:protein FATTY ACID EXPORT 3, chloroplastic n=1 Tax=Cryptomeria japonica TaxID=3369 RepID=UPI0025ABA75D|nr:protein FATTY ACID EXPORT 3, chloroplastic [Cryptomeria japonica]XP_057818116.1 protein FATTY ACID EXPORT 3, chloroplastic [Cryptomeria japonica]
MAFCKVDCSLKKNVVARGLPSIPALHRNRNGSKAVLQCCLGSSRVLNLGFKGLNVSHSSGFAGVAGLRLRGSTSNLLKNDFVAFASQEESAPSDIEVEMVRNEFEKQAEETEEAMKQTMSAIKEQPSTVQEIFKALSKMLVNSRVELEKLWLKLEKVRNPEKLDVELKQRIKAMEEQTTRMLEISNEAYIVYAEKAKIALKDATEQLKLQTENTRGLLVSTAEEISIKGKQNFSVLVENAPEHVKEIVVVAFDTHPEDLQKLSGIHDFCLGIPYGALLFVGGLLSFLITGSIPAIRFGIILGGIHLAMSSLSLKAWKKGNSRVTYVKVQFAVALIIFVREMRVLFQRPALFPGGFMAFVSAAMLLFYSFLLLSDGNQLKNAKPESSD